MNDLERQGLIEEYKLVAQEKASQYRTRDYTTVLALTVGFSALGFGIKEDRPEAFFYVFPFFVFLALFANFAAGTLLGLKADTYLQEVLEPQVSTLNWFRMKSYFKIGKARPINRWLNVLIFSGLIFGSLYFVDLRAGWHWSLPLAGIAAVVVFVSSRHYLYYSVEDYRSQWRTIEARLQKPSSLTPSGVPHSEDESDEQD